MGWTHSAASSTRISIDFLAMRLLSSTICSRSLLVFLRRRKKYIDNQMLHPITKAPVNAMPMIAGRSVRMVSGGEGPPPRGSEVARAAMGGGECVMGVQH